MLFSQTSSQGEDRAFPINPNCPNGKHPHLSNGGFNNKSGQIKRDPQKGLLSHQSLPGFLTLAKQTLQ